MKNLLITFSAILSIYMITSAHTVLGQEKKEIDASTVTNTLQNISEEDLPFKIIPAGTSLPIVLNSNIVEGSAQPSDVVTGVTASDVILNDGSFIPAGVGVQGHIIVAEESKRIRDKAKISFTLDYIKLGNKYYKVITNEAIFEGADKGKKVIRGAAKGAAVGFAAGSVNNAFTNNPRNRYNLGKTAGAGAAVAVAGAALKSGSQGVTIPAGTKVNFQLAEEFSVNQKIINEL